MAADLNRDRDRYGRTEDLGGMLRHALDAMREGFQIISPDFRYLYVNPQAAAHGRRTPEELNGRTMEECYPGIRDTPLFGELARCMRSRTSTVFENEFEFPDGKRRWFEIRIAPVPDGVCVYSIDIQKRKEAEAALLRLKDQLT
jgi:PAS domain S-box-containing protein